MRGREREGDRQTDRQTGRTKAAKVGNSEADRKKWKGDEELACGRQDKFREES